jgi:hypothetical protein
MVVAHSDLRAVPKEKYPSLRMTPQLAAPKPKRSKQDEFRSKRDDGREKNEDAVKGVVGEGAGRRNQRVNKITDSGDCEKCEKM